MAEYTYQQQIDMKNLELIRNICNDMPDFINRFFRGIQQTTSTRSRLGYARDIKHFFEYIVEQKQLNSMKEITLDMLSQVDTEFIEIYMDYLQMYEKDGRIYTNQKPTIKRKLSSLSVLYKYLYKNDLITENAFSKVDKPKLREKQIVRMDAAEVANFLDTVEYGNKLTEHQLKYHEKTKTRDLAIMSLMLSTGIRISECVGLDIRDVNFDDASIRIFRKGGKESIVYFSDEAAAPLAEYIEERKKIEALPGHENALFLSSQKKRINVRSVENMVKKYAQSAVPLKHITPHKLRSTYGTSLYQETSDIYLVAEVLGHSDVNTTRKHYADIENQRKRAARNKVTLRESDNNK